MSVIGIDCGAREGGREVGRREESRKKLITWNRALGDG
jgi:hypothetical protein